MTHFITVKALARAARQLAQENPDRSAVCTYVRYEGEKLVPNCIVGTAAHQLGVTLEELNAVNTCGIRHMIYNDTPEWLDASGDNDAPLIAWLGRLQSSQDGGSTWGEALTHADRYLVADQFDI